MEEDITPAASTAEPSAMLVLLALLVAALALKVVLTSAREGERARGWRAIAVALWPGALAWGLGLWAAGLLAVVGLEPVSDLRLSLLDACWLFAAALLSAFPPLLLLARRNSRPQSTRRLGGSALLLALPAMAMPLGWLHAARLDPAPLWLPLWAAMGVAVATAGLGAALALAYGRLGESHPARRLWRTAAAVCGGVALLLGQMLVHEGALVSDAAFSLASATVPMALMSGLGALTPMLLVGLMVLQRLRRYASEDQRHGGSRPDRTDRRRRPRSTGSGRDRRTEDHPSLLNSHIDSALGAATQPHATAQQPRRRSKHQRHRVL
jgi:hypothetical protein